MFTFSNLQVFYHCVYHFVFILGKYIFIESSAPRLENETAQIQSAPITLYGTNPICLNFWYNMYGSSIGELNVYLKNEHDSATPMLKVWSLHGNQGQGWHAAKVPVTSSNTFRVCFISYYKINDLHI